MTIRPYSIILYLTFFSLPLVATFKGKGTVVLVFILLIAHGKTLWTQRHYLKQDLLQATKNPVGFWAGGFALWALLSTFWAPDTQQAFFNALRYLLLILSGMLLFVGVKRETEEKKQVFFKAFYRGFIFYMLFFLIEIYVLPLGSKLYSQSISFAKTLFIKGIVNLCFLFWPFSLVFVKKLSKIARWICFLFLCLTLFYAGPHAALLGIIAGTIGSFCICRFPKTPYVIATLLSLFILSTPLIFTQVVNRGVLGENFHYLPFSYQHRLLIWEKMSEETLKCPLIGQGFDSSTTFSKGEFVNLKIYEIPFNSETQVPVIGGRTPSYIFSSHPHNGIVQIWVEMGLVGIFLILGLLWSLTQRIANIQNPLERSTLFGFLLFYEVVHLVGFGVWQKWIGASIILSLLCFYVVKNHQETEV
jgi:O-antigen ligase